MPISTSDWVTLAMIVSPWALVVALILSRRSFGQYSEQRKAITEARNEIRLARAALRASHERELAYMQAEVNSLRELIHARAENLILRQRDSA